MLRAFPVLHRGTPSSTSDVVWCSTQSYFVSSKVQKTSESGTASKRMGRASDRRGRKEEGTGGKKEERSVMAQRNMHASETLGSRRQRQDICRLLRSGSVWGLGHLFLGVLRSLPSLSLARRLRFSVFASPPPRPRPPSLSTRKARIIAPVSHTSTHSCLYQHAQTPTQKTTQHNTSCPV